MRSPLTNEPLLVLELEGVEIDYCPLTHGIWLDAGELEELYHDRQAAESLIASLKIDESSREQRVRCPICRKKMEKVLAEDKILIDRCKYGHGLWFDEGELIEVLRLDENNEEGKVIHLLKEMFQNQINKDNQ